MLYNLLTKKVSVTSFKQTILPMIINILAVSITVVSNVVGENMSLTIKIGLPLLLISYLIIMGTYLPLLFTMRWFRGERLIGNIFLTSIIILLWGFVPLSSLWILLALGKLFITIPWEIFSKAFIWSKILIVPLSLAVFYWRYTKEEFSDSIIDSMVVSGAMVMLSLINF